MNNAANALPPSSSKPQKFSEVLNELHVSALKALLLSVWVGSVIMAPALYVREGWSILTFLTLLTSASVGGMWILIKFGQVQWATRCMVFLLLLVGTVGIIHNGSVRSAATYVLLVSMVIAGSYLSKAEVLGTGAYAVIMLGLFNWLEQQGQLSGGLLPVGWTVWLIQAVVMGAILITSLFGRYRLMQVVREQEAALEAAQSAQAYLSASQSRFQALFANNPVACLVQSYKTLQVLDANEAFCKLFGYPRDTLFNQPSQSLTPLWADPKAKQRFIQDMLDHGQVRDVYTQGVRRDGTLIDCLVYGEVIPQAGEPIVLIMVLDISKETASHNELEKSQERFRKAFEFSPLGMTITRFNDGKIMAANQANESVLGWTAEDFEGKTMEEVGVWITAADRQLFVDGLRQNGRLHGHEATMNTKQGGQADVRVWAERIELEGEACALSFTLNVTQEKQRETMLMNIAKGVSSHTGEAFFPSWAEHLSTAVGASHILVVESAEEARFNTLALHADGALQPLEPVDMPGKLLARLLLHEGIFFAEHLGVNDLDLIPAFAMAQGQPIKAIAATLLKDADSSVIGLVFVAWTTTPKLQNANLHALLSIFSSRCNAELIRLQRDREISRLYDTLEQRVHARTAQLTYLNRELDSFAYSVSHDLKSPLRSIDGFLHMLRDQMAERMTPDDEYLFKKVSSSASRMGGLIADMLSLARVSQGQLKRTTVNLSELINSAFLREKDRDPNHEVKVSVAPDLQTDCDPDLAQIVLENLVGNAWKYTHKKDHPRIEVGQRVTEPGAPAVFYVKDNGAGFDMAQSVRLFQPFSRLHSAREFEGSGIGLATVRRILERHEGFIRAEGEVGIGATFEFSFGLNSAD